MDYQVEGGFNTFKGDIDSLVAHGGVFHIYGNVGSMVQHGGVIYDHRSVKADRVQIVTDKMSDQERERELNDNVLVQRIDQLWSQLTKEREAHKKEIDELEWRLKAVTDIANGRNKRIYEDETNGHPVAVTDDSFDVLFTLINEFPINNDVDTAEELGISVKTLRFIAKVLRLAKSPEARREAKERLKRHGIEKIERRGGDTSNKRK